MARLYDWTFPLPRTHTGMLLGNATFGAIIWGQGRTLSITLGRADCWDHRGGMHWRPEQSYAAIRDALENGTAEVLPTLFAADPHPDGVPHRPSVLPIGRLDLVLPKGATLVRGQLDMDQGEVTIHVQQDGDELAMVATLDMERPVIAMRYPRELELQVHRVPAWQYVGEHLAAISFEEPEMLDSASFSGWRQPVPEDPDVCVGYRLQPGYLRAAVTFGDDRDALITGHELVLDERSFSDIRKTTRAWWRGYWQRVPAVDVPNTKLRFLYDYGMFKFAGLTQPSGVAATLQGPWIEEYQMPPWSSDYHFNINVQMCYWPAYHSNLLLHLRPLFDLIQSWLPQLRENARHFVGIEDGVMLPHAVDDRCTCMGGFWTGTIDHGCTAWVAQMMHRYYRYTQDRAFLEAVAFPFMHGAFRVYQEMLERQPDGSYRLPVSVSPEYGGSATDAWGANASFQLACIHRLCEDLLAAAEVLEEEPDPAWRDIHENCPKVSAIEGENGSRIALWEGQDLERSHRHHSHLAGITPFDTLDWDDPETVKLIHNSIAHWIGQGAGQWSGWCVPWASMIHSRLGNADAAELWLEIWERVFTNEGHGTLHDVHFAGFSLMGKQAVNLHENKKEIMQIEAGMSAVTAIQEMLCHEQRGVVQLFCGAPAGWQECGFEGMCVDGGFLLSARRVDGQVGRITIESPHGGVLRLRNPWPGNSVKLRRADNTTETLDGEVLAIEAQAGEKVRLRRG